MLAPDEILLILSQWQKRWNVLVFGLGKDSPLWAVKAWFSKGSVLFVEDNEMWIALMRRRYPALRIEKVQYQTVKSEWERYLSGARPIPTLRLPDDVTSTRYDMVLVDGPLGYPDNSPGRAQSLRTAAELTTHLGVIIVDDYDRYVDRAMADHILAAHGYECVCLSQRKKTAVFWPGQERDG
jgi:hypothetical protein